MKIDTPIPPEFFSPSRQFLRVLAHDWRLFNKDIVFGAFYALIGFFGKFGAIASNAQHHILIMPFVLLAVAVGVMAYRLCIAETNPVSAAFYFNLPRSRALTQAAHVALLAAMALGYELLILLAAALRLNLPPGAPGYSIQPHLALIPFWTLSILVWLVYVARRSGRDLDSLSVLLLLVSFGAIIVLPILMALMASARQPPTLTDYYFFAFIELILIAVQFADAFRVWRHVQIGANK